MNRRHTGKEREENLRCGGNGNDGADHGDRGAGRLVIREIRVLAVPPA